MSEPQDKPNPVWIWFGIVIFCVMGLIMLSHGLGLHDARWFNPNPDVPASIFAIIGAIMLLAVPLMLAQVVSVHRQLVNVAGYTLLVLAFAVSHWMIFFAQGGSCSLEGITVVLGLPDFLCTVLFGSVLAIIDVIVILLAGRAVLRWLNSTARS